MRQQGNSINPANIQHFLDSAENAAQMGQRQFFTPPDLAKALLAPIGRNAATAVVDLMHGSGHLLEAPRKEWRFGIDVDARSPAHCKGKGLRTYQADVTRWYPLAAAANFQADLMLLNPPFSLRWDLSRLSALADSPVEGVAAAYAAARKAGTHIDSTPATLMIALDRLSRDGEGYLICNASTARRFFGDPESSPQSTIVNRQSSIFSPLMRYLWAWAEIPGAVYEGQNSSFTTAVLYFSRSHGTLNSPAYRPLRLPLYVETPSADPDTVATSLRRFADDAALHRFGSRIQSDYQAIKADAIADVWDGISAEYHALHHGARPAFNIRIAPNGTIATHLDPFRKHAYVHDRQLLSTLHGLHGQLPSALVVQQASRAALKHAIHSGVWRVEDAVLDAVAEALREYDAVRAPFYRPNPVQALGWIDEESELVCSANGIPGIHKGDRLPLRTWIEDTLWHATRTSLGGKAEAFESRGRELVVELTATDGTLHLFHVRRDDATAQLDQAAIDATILRRIEQAQAKSAPKEADNLRHHDIRALLDHFHIPIPADIAETRPEEYQANLAALTQLEEIINAA